MQVPKGCISGFSLLDTSRLSRIQMLFIERQISSFPIPKRVACLRMTIGIYTCVRISPHLRSDSSLTPFQVICLTTWSCVSTSEKVTTLSFPPAVKLSDDRRRLVLPIGTYTAYGTQDVGFSFPSSHTLHVPGRP